RLLPVRATFSALMTMTKSPPSTWGAKVGLCLPRSSVAAWLARRPRTTSVASMTYQLRSASPALGVYVRTGVNLRSRVVLLLSTLAPLSRSAASRSELRRARTDEQVLWSSRAMNARGGRVGGACTREHAQRRPRVPAAWQRVKVTPTTPTARSRAPVGAPDPRVAPEGRRCSDTVRPGCPHWGHEREHPGDLHRQRPRLRGRQRPAPPRGHARRAGCRRPARRGLLPARARPDPPDG